MCVSERRVKMPSLYSKPNGYTSAGTKRFKPDSKKYLYNIDTFYYNCRSHYYGQVMDKGLREKLIEGRSFSADNNNNMTLEIKIPTYENPLIFKIMPGNPPAYQYSIRNDSMAIYFTKNELESGSHMRVQINQFVLWEKGFIGAYEESLEVLKSLGFLPYEKKINRIDFAVHSDQFIWTLKDIETFEYPLNISKDNFPNFVKLNPISGAFNTVNFGDRSRLYLRIYNKSKEIEAKKKYYFNEIYREYGMDVDNVWNFEIEVHRPYLKDLVELDQDDEFKKIYNDLDYCIENDGISKLWTHLISKYNHDSAHWSVLKQGDKNKFNFTTNSNLEIVKDIHSNYERELNQIAGRLMIGVLDQEDYSLENALEVFKEKYLRGNEHEKSIEFLDKVEMKKQNIQSQSINKTILKQRMRNQNNMRNLDKSDLTDLEHLNQKNYIRVQEIQKNANP